MKEDNRKQLEEEPQELASEKKQILRRYTAIELLLGVTVLLIIVFLFKITVNRKNILETVKNQDKPSQLVKPDRGNIYSADGKLMASSVPRYYMYMDFKADGFRDSFFYSKNNGVDSLAFYLSRKLKNRSAKEYKDHLVRGLKSRSREYPIYEGHVSFADMQDIKKFPFIRRGSNVSGFYTQEIIQRQKFFGSLASRTVGDIYNEIETGGLPKGKNGLELQYDSLLCGSYGTKRIIRVGKGWTEVVEEEPVSGMDIVTTIDVLIQDITEKALNDKLREIDAETGTAIVMEVRTGEIKAISNFERVRPGVYTETRTRNFAVADMVEPGSTFKVPSIMVALEDGVCVPDDRVETGNGRFHYSGREITDHNVNHGGYHNISVAEAIWYSSNIGVAKMILKGYENQPGKFVEGLKRIGISADLGIEIPGAGHPMIKTPADHTWSKQTLPSMSFGYEVQTPPISILAFYNAIANDGKMIRPIFVKEIRKNGKTEKRFSTEVVRSSICSGKTLNIIREMLVNVVEQGTGAAVRSDAVPIAGKTGTARIAAGGGYNSHQVSFCGYFPADNPEYSCMVMIRRPRMGYPSGGTMAGGVFKTIAEKIYSDQSKIEVRSMESDSVRVILPEVKSGNTDALAYILDELDVKTQPRRIDAGYVTGLRRTEKNYIELKPLTVIENLVPNVIGMGAKDAVYLLESSGLRVNLSGRGRVVSQSLSSGQHITKGQTVTIVLNN